MMAEIRPTQLSVLNVLDRLHDPEERGEDNDRDRDHQQIIHHNSLWLRLRVKQTRSSATCHPVHAPFMRDLGAFLTIPMQDPGFGRAPAGRVSRASGPGGPTRAARAARAAP